MSRACQRFLADLLLALGRSHDDGCAPTFRDVRTAMLAPDADVRERMPTALQR